VEFDRVPHTLMSGETVNNIIGYTWNSKNRHLSAGGSSGGNNNPLASMMGSDCLQVKGLSLV